MSLTLNIGDDIFKQIFKRLYYPDCPYEYSVIEADILGSIYERFLGNVIYLSKDHQAKVDQKPEVRKAGGVYYTPSYIVKYIVENTVGKLVEGKTPEEVSKLRICDPACGSGSFLLEAFHFLLEWHHKYYLANKPAEIFKKKGSPLVMTADGNYKLSLAERKRILVNNIYGVDIDAQAVEVTKLSLLLKVIESLLPADLLDKRILPDLGTNIKCGNSLIGTDFFKGKSIEDWNKIRPFDWDEEFPEIFKNGGFDTVIGNPPYGAQFIDIEKDYILNKYPIVPSKTKDSYMYFIDKGIKILKESGFLGFIMPNTWLLINNAKDFRKFILEYKLLELIDQGDKVFPGVIVECCTFILKKSLCENSKCHAVRLRKNAIISESFINQSTWLNNDYSRIVIEFNDEKSQLISKFSSHKKFGETCSIIFGIKPYQEGLGNPPQTRDIIEKRIFHSNKSKDDQWKRLLTGTEITRYFIDYKKEQYIKYGKWLMYPSNESKILNPKILLRRTSHDIKACLDNDKYYPQNSIFIIDSESINLYYLLGLLNSELLNWVYRISNPQKGKIFAEVKPSVIKFLPIKEIDFNNKKDVERHDAMVRLVEQMLELNKRLQQAKTPDDKELLSRQIEATDRQIDGLVYELYELTPEEIAIVEESTK